jgi:hypothetical protein
MNETFLSSLGFKLILLLTAGVAVTTVGVAATRVSSAMNDNKVPKQGLEISEVTPEPKPEVAGTELKLIEEVKEKRTEGKCIITLFSKQYDVTEPNKAGGTGDLFDCGEDMTSKYSAKYGNNVAMMDKYLVGGTPTQTPTTAVNNPSVTPLPTSTKSGDDSKGIRFDDDRNEREDKEHEERYEKREDREHEEKQETEKTEIEGKDD